MRSDDDKAERLHRSCARGPFRFSFLVLARDAEAAYNSTMRVGIVQLNSHVGAVERNVEAILSYISEAKKEHCDLVVFPELAVCGYSPSDLLWRAGFAEQVASGLEAVVHHSKGIGVITDQ